MNAIRVSLPFLACVALLPAFAGPLAVETLAADRPAALTPQLPGPCDTGTCIEGAFCESSSCPSPVCYARDTPISLTRCGGVIGGCCGYGFCVSTSYCGSIPLPGQPRCVGFCMDSKSPLSQVLCGEALHPRCGVGTCFDGSYCDDCYCYGPESPVSQVFCGCRRCGEITPGCGQATCVGAGLCDDCLCYGSTHPIAQKCCPGGENTFQHVYTRGEHGFDHAIAGLLTRDGGYLLAGCAENWSVAMKTDAAGRLSWRKTYREFCWWAAAETSDGYVLAGRSRLTRTDASGNVLWAKLLPGEGRAVAVTSDGGLIVAGTKDGDAYLLKTDAAGTYTWAARYGGAGSEEGRSVVEMPDGGFLLLGHTQSFGAGGQDLLLVRTDAGGGLLWGKTVGGVKNDGHLGVTPYRMIGTRDGGFLIAASTESFGQGSWDMLAVKLDPTGALSWARAYGGESSDEGDAVGERFDGGYFLMGEEHSFFKGITLLSLAANGALEWARSYGPDPYFNYVDGGVANDGGAWIATESHTHPKAHPSHWFYLLKTDRDGRTRGCCDQQAVPLVETSVAVAAVPASVVRTLLPGPLISASPDSQDQPVDTVTLCESSAEYLCNGVLTGECLCTP